MYTVKDPSGRQSETKKAPTVKVDMTAVRYIFEVVQRQTSVAAWMNVEEATLFRNEITISSAKSRAEQEIENARYAEIAKRIWRSARRYGFVLWQPVMYKALQRVFPHIIEPADLRAIEFAVSKADGERRWTVTDSAGKVHRIFCVEWKPVTSAGALQSDMALLIPAVREYEAEARQKLQAMDELARMPHVIETQPPRDPPRHMLNMQAASHPGAMGASASLGLPSGAHVPLIDDPAGLMTEMGDFPQDSRDQKVMLQRIIEARDKPVVPLPNVDLLVHPSDPADGKDPYTGDELERTRRATFLLKPNFRLVPQPFAFPYLPNMQQAREQLENAVSEVSSTARLFWSDSAVDRSESAHRIATERHEAQTALVRNFVCKHLHNMYLFVNSSQEALHRTMYGAPSYSKFEMPSSLSTQRLELALNAGIITKAEYRDYLAQLMGITISPEARREAEAADAREHELEQHTHDQQMADPGVGASVAAASSPAGKKKRLRDKDGKDEKTSSSENERSKKKPKRK